MEPPKEAEYTGIYTQQQDNPVHNNRKQNKFDNLRQQVRQLKIIQNTNETKTTAPRRCRRIFPSGSRGRRRSCIPTCLLGVILSRPERHVNERVRNAK
jgi:hypothetical protein